MENNYNYIDALTSSAYKQYSSDQADNNIQLHGRKAYIFLLDKKETKTNVYEEEKTGRVYLPHFVQRGLYKTNVFSASLSVINYTETEENLEIEFNFNRMVKNINELKTSKSGKLKIVSKSKVPISIIINDSFIIRKEQGEILFKKDFEEKSIFHFLEELNKECSLVKLEYNGNTEDAASTEKVSFTLKPKREKEINVFSSTYKNTTDVIELGTIIITDKYRAYEVVSAYPTNDTYGNYISWTVKCGLVNLARIDSLPSDFNEIIKKKQFNLEKINYE